MLFLRNFWKRIRHFVIDRPPCVFFIINGSPTCIELSMLVKHLCIAHDFLWTHVKSLSFHFSKICTKFDARLLFLSQTHHEITISGSTHMHEIVYIMLLQLLSRWHYQTWMFRIPLHITSHYYLRLLVLRTMSAVISESGHQQSIHWSLTQNQCLFVCVCVSLHI